MDLDTKIGQMIMVGFQGLEIKQDHQIARDINKFSIGGVIFFDKNLDLKTNYRNIKSLNQLKLLTESLQQASNIQLLTAIDQEGGKIARLKPELGFPETLSAEELGRKTPETTFKQASEMAENLAYLGINFNLAPVVDLNINPENPIIGKLARSFSKDPDIVISHAAAFIKAHKQQGVLCCLKHFPGHGSSEKDSHLSPVVEITKTWSDIELAPYKELIKKGLADSIMTAHVINQNMDKNLPATLSPLIIKNILRKELNYQGIVLTDDLQMAAINQDYDSRKTIQFALDADVDILVIGNNLKYDEQIVSRIIKIIKNLIKEKLISEERIHKSFIRICRMKKTLSRNSKCRVTLS
jgi:beta-N-acetylhexosaminidase